MVGQYGGKRFCLTGIALSFTIPEITHAHTCAQMNVQRENWWRRNCPGVFRYTILLIKPMYHTRRCHERYVGTHGLVATYSCA